LSVTDTGTEFFATILDDMANKGGLPEYIAAIGAVGAIAAMMSTVDSALLSVTNLISTDFLRNWLMPTASDKTLLRACKAISLVVLLVCVAIALYDPKLK
jgi:Na+/proline symporter